MKELIENVVQWGRDRGLDKVGHLAQAKYTLKETAELLDAYADGDVDKINDAIGDIAVTLIVGASNDEDLLEELIRFMCQSDYSETDRINGCFFNSFERIMLFEGRLYKNCKTNGLYGSNYMNIIDELTTILFVINHEFTQALSLKDCLQLAYDEIKNRKGKMINGQFIKD